MAKIRTSFSDKPSVAVQTETHWFYQEHILTPLTGRQLTEAAAVVVTGFRSLFWIPI